MNSTTITQAKKYALAFLNCYEKELTLPHIQSVGQAAHFLAAHRPTLRLFSLPLVSAQSAQKGLNTLLKDYDFPEHFNALYHLLFERKKIGLLAEILQQIVSVYQARHNIMHVTLQSADHLSDEQAALLEKFIANHTQKIIVSDRQLTPELIAGIRLQSDSILWEHSVAKSLREISKALGQ